MSIYIILFPPLLLGDEDCRIKIHEAQGTAKLFEWYGDMAFVVQLETLAALVNLTLSVKITDEMVEIHNCIPFFIDLVSSNKLKHSQFAAIALANIARKEIHRDQIRKHGGIQALVGCIMSSDYYKRRYGCLALANVALSPSKEIIHVFESKVLLQRVIKMALRKEIETQREVIALLRNLSCHAKLRPTLLERGVMDTVHVSRDSVFPEVRQWCTEISLLMEREIQSNRIDVQRTVAGHKRSAPDLELLKKMEPLSGQVEWSTWGSKLENMFSIIFAEVPTLKNSNVVTGMNESVVVDLCNGVSSSLIKNMKDSVTFTILQRPAHGTLDDPVSNTIRYHPAKGFSGADFFIYRMNISGGSTWPTTVSITVTETAQRKLAMLNSAVPYIDDHSPAMEMVNVGGGPAAAAGASADAAGGSSDDDDGDSNQDKRWLKRVRMSMIQPNTLMTSSMPSPASGVTGAAAAPPPPPSNT